MKSQDDEFVNQQMRNKSHPVVKLYDYLNMRINPYASLAVDVVEPRGLPLQQNFENSFSFADYSLRENGTENEIVYRSESFRILWSDVNVLVLRGSTGFLNGLFGDSNSTKCGSRLVQMNTLLNNMIITPDLDPFLKLLAEMFGTVGYTSFHCYFMTKDLFIDSLDIISDYVALGEKGVYFYHIVYFNFIWNQRSILDSFRAFQIITAQKIFVQNLEPTNQL